VTGPEATGGLGAGPRRSLIVGLAVTGRAMARALVARGGEVVAIDDHPTDAARTAAESLGVTLIEAPSAATVEELVGTVDAVLPSPLVADRHPALVAARAGGVPVMSELDLARLWDDRPLVAITGTDGKTTVTTLVTAMLEASGRRALDVGNTDVPLVEALDRPEIEVFVVEASSFRLAHTVRFEPSVAAWLNFAPDHLDVHADLATYEAAKARLWAHLGPDAVVVANAADPVVLRNVPPGASVVTFGAAGDVRVDDGVIVAADGSAVVAVADLWRSLPHDVDNALAAVAVALAAGASLEGARAALRAFRGLPHRVELVGEWDGVAWYDDSKATVPHATLAAVRGFRDVVLIAGGRNKGLDLAPLADAHQVRAVVAIGEAADEVAAAFAGRVPVQVVRTSIDDAVAAAAELARPGDVVVLSPGCASFDWFRDYHHRGQAFQDAVRHRAGVVAS
jgi:UDP-N-acetylmuramoylalanine--D-glutamate ligase